MARFLFVNQYYWPDVASTGQHLTDLAESLARAGHQVEVVCSRGRYLQGRGQARRREEHNGVTIRRLAASSFGKRRELGRLVDYLTFHALCVLAMLRRGRRDVVVTLTTPPLIGLWGAMLRALFGTRHVCFVMDLHPDAEFAAGMLRRTSLFGRLVEWLSRWHMRRADACVVLGNGQRQLLLEKGVREARIVEIPVWSDPDELRPLPHVQNPLRSELGWEQRFVVMYSGNAGLAHTFDEVLAAAAELEHSNPEVLFAFVGGGPRTPAIRAEVEQRGLSNAIFLPYFPREAIGCSIPAADAHLVTLRSEFLGIAVPGKLYGILAAGRPVLFVGPQSASSAETVRRAQAGEVLASCDAAGLAAAIRRLASDPTRAAAMGRSGRAYFERVHARGPCCEAWRELLEDLAGVAVPETVPADRGLAPVLRDPRLAGDEVLRKRAG